MMEQIRISGKNLGALAIASFRPRCFWLKLHCGDKLPYQIFPGIFSSIDSYTKKVIHETYKKYRKIPRWLKPFGNLICPVQTPTLATFYTVDPETNIKLTGVPDDIFYCGDDSFFIVDYKTAKFTDNQDKLLPMYETQLNAYAYIAHRTDVKPVSGIGLVYYEPMTELNTDAIDSVTNENGFDLAFDGKLLPLDLNPDGKIPPLLKKVREVYAYKSTPIGRLGCEDCQKLENLFRLLHL
jgi:hypothetical protein